MGKTTFKSVYFISSWTKGIRIETIRNQKRKILYYLIHKYKYINAERFKNIFHKRKNMIKYARIPVGKVVCGIFLAWSIRFGILNDPNAKPKSFETTSGISKINSLNKEINNPESLKTFKTKLITGSGDIFAFDGNKQGFNTKEEAIEGVDQFSEINLAVQNPESLSQNSKLLTEYDYLMGRENDVILAAAFQGKIVEPSDLQIDADNNHRVNVNFRLIIADTKDPKRNLDVTASIPEDRIVDWFIDPVGKTGKSSFARAYVSGIPTDGLLMKIDNLDRMELTLISKIEDYRKKYYKDPKVIFFDFPRATNSKQVVSATCLMEDAKSAHLETSFGGRMKEIDISDIHVIVFSNTAPDLSILSEDRWRLWKLGGTKYENIMWPCSITTYVKDFHEKNKVITWQVRLTGILPKNLKTEYQFRNLDLNENWYYKKSSNNKIFGLEPQSTKPMVTTIPESPNFVRLGLSNYLKSSE